MHIIQKLLSAGQGTEFGVRSYTGRGCRESCLGVTMDAHYELGGLFAHLLRETIRSNHNNAYSNMDMLADLSDAFDNMRSDSLGRGTIVYFPGIKYEEE